MSSRVTCLRMTALAESSVIGCRGIQWHLKELYPLRGETAARGALDVPISRGTRQIPASEHTERGRERNEGKERQGKATSEQKCRSKHNADRDNSHVSKRYPDMDPTEH